MLPTSVVVDTTEPEDNGVSLMGSVKWGQLIVVSSQSGEAIFW